MKNQFIVIALLGGLGLLHFSPTAAAQPLAATLAPASITETNATLNGTVNPNGAAAVAYFQYGLTTNYDNLGGFVALPATNITLALPALTVNALRSPAGTSWTTTTAPNTTWNCIASSADGSRLAAVVASSGGTGGIYTSTNAGATWTPTTAPGEDWFGIASSADGLRLAATAFPYIYTSTNGGVSWRQTGAPIQQWQDIASSADGSRLAAAVNGDSIYTSTNGGATWTQSGAFSGEWQSLASSADGLRLAAGLFDAPIYTSTNGGGAWGPSGSLTEVWPSIASSADGLRLATVTQGDIFTSTNGGTVWNRSVLAPNANYFAIACSADGTRLAAGADGGGIYISTDAGNTWTLGNAPTASWYSIASSADGSQLAAVANSGGIDVSAGPTNDLTPATTYHYRVVSVNTAGTSLGSDQTFTTLAPPTVTTLAADGVITTNATLNGTVNPNGAATVAYFRYGLTVSYGSFSPTNTLVATNLILSVTNLVKNLTPDTTYHFQLVATNSTGTSLGNDLAFTTAGQPVVATLPATGVTPNSAILNGTVNPGWEATVAYFRYGTTVSYGSYSATNTLAATNAILSVSNQLSNLTPGTAYHYQLVATNSEGTTLGGDLTFMVPAQPVVTTLPATGITTTNATLNGTVNPMGAISTAYFQYGLTTNYDCLGGLTTLPATNITLALPGLVVNTLHSAAGTNWLLTSAPSTGWQCIASSADGARLAAVAGGATGLIYTSTNAGLTWTATSAPGTNWYSIAASADGTRLAAGINNGGIYLSTNGGAVWTLTSAPKAEWECIAASADGSQLAAVDNDAGGIYTSINGGVTWTITSAPHADWQGIASSADGSRLAAAESSGGAGGIFTSTNGGASWTLSGAGSTTWKSVASSADGSRLAAGCLGYIYVSANGGVTWSPTGTPFGYWYSVASSADGSRLAAGLNTGGLYTSTNGGFSWQAGNAPGAGWYAIAGSAAGSQWAAVPDGGGIYMNTGPTNNLTPGATYHYRAVANNLAGTSVGNDLTFTTSPAIPTVATLAATAITTTNATLNGTVNPNGGATTVYFQYGPTLGYGSFSTSNALAATNLILSVTNLISNLPPNTPCHFRVVAYNSAGTGVGADLAFTPLAQAVNFKLTGAVKLPGGALQLNFTNLDGLSFTVLGTTNVALPVTNWTVLGAPVEAPPGHYQFTDPQATNTPARYYRVRSP